MKIIGIIPSRYGSTRFPGKPLIDIQGKSMIQRVYEQSIKSEIFAKVVVATDDDRIYKHVQQFGGDVRMTNASHSCGTDRCIEVIESESETYDIVINIQGDEPLINPNQLESLAKAFQDPSTEIATLVKPIESMEILKDASKIKVVIAQNGNALYFSRLAVPHTANCESALNEGLYLKHIGIYAFRTNTLLKIMGLRQTPLEKSESLEQLRWLENGMNIKTVRTEFDSISVDVPADLDRVIRILNGA
ncbi:MAG: 3-deoxy-manno-octulosonate cytidylyltransferase [Salibacteraceae bacterium]